MDRQENSVRSDFEAVVKDVKNLKADTATLAGDMQNQASEAVSGRLNRIESTVSEIWNSLRETGTNSYETVERNVEQRPMTSILAAFVAGAAIGWALDRTR